MCQRSSAAQLFTVYFYYRFIYILKFNNHNFYLILKCDNFVTQIFQVRFFFSMSEKQGKLILKEVLTFNLWTRCTLIMHTEKKTYIYELNIYSLTLISHVFTRFSDNSSHHCHSIFCKSPVLSFRKCMATGRDNGFMFIWVSGPILLRYTTYTQRH